MFIFPILGLVGLTTRPLTLSLLSNLRSQQSDSVGLVVVSEEDQQPLLVHRISREDIYQRQGGDTIITWTDPDINTDIALSFQEAVGCNYIWEQIKSVQMTYAKNERERGELPGRMRRGAVDEYEFGSAPGDGFYQDSGRQGPNELPPAELGNLEELVAVVADCSPFAREKIASLVMRKGYLRQLLDLFKMCEDLEDRTGLALMYRLVKGLVLLNDANLFDELLRDDNVMDVVGALEYECLAEEFAREREEQEREEEALRKLEVEGAVAEDRAEDGAAAEPSGNAGGEGSDAAAQNAERTESGGEASTVTTRAPPTVRPPLPPPPQHRAFLRDSVVFKEVVPIQDAAIRAKIHQTYRIGYLKDVILPRVLDDATFGTLTSIMLFNNVEVVLALQADPTFLKELFARLRKTPRTEPEWDDLVGFLQELCSLAKHLQVQQRGSLFASLVQHGLFQVLTDVLQTDIESSQLKGADVLMSTLHNDPSALRAFLVKQEHHVLFSRIVQLFVEGEEGLQAQLFELLKLMLDPETMDQPVEKSGFLELFYDKYVDKLIQSISAGVRDEPPPFAGTPDRNKDPLRGTGSPVPAWTLVKTIELLCFCVQHHSFRIKYYVLRNNVVEKVLNLMQRREKYLVVAAVRFLRACVGLKDEFYNRYIIKNTLFAPVMKVFVANGDKYNLLNSAVLELVDFIRRENIKALVAHLVENYEAMFETVTYVDTFRLLKVRYEQRNQQEVGAAPSGEGRELVGILGSHGHAGAGEAGVMFSREAVAAQQAIESARRRRDGSMDKSEEDYFNSEDDDDDPLPVAEDFGEPEGPALPPLSGRFIPMHAGDEVDLLSGAKRPLGDGDEEEGGKRQRIHSEEDGKGLGLGDGDSEQVKPTTTPMGSWVSVNEGEEKEDAGNGP